MRARSSAPSTTTPSSRTRLVSAEIAEWATAGERQRILAGVPSEFVVYGDVAVVGPEVWGDPESQYVVVRDRMLVHAFIEVFDRMWASASPIPTRRTSDLAEDDHLLALLGRGFKDEAIARYLGWSLRTVRRRVARLMEELGAKTQFQLGAEAVRTGRLESKGAEPAPPHTRVRDQGPGSWARSSATDSLDRARPLTQARETGVDTAPRTGSRRCADAGCGAGGRPMGRRGQGQGDRPARRQLRLRRQVQRRQQRRPHDRHRVGERPEKYALHLLPERHPHPDVYAGHRQRGRRRPGRAVPRDRRPRGRGVDTSKLVVSANARHRRTTGTSTR